MSEDEMEFDDVEDALRRADELSELTGRDKKDIIADLLDDGKLNRSAGEDTEDKKDFLDKAQEQAEKLKTLLTTLIPVFALLMGIGAEGLGVLDLTDWGSESIWDEEDSYSQNGGCLDPMANNYDPSADYDDGSCMWDTNGNGGGGGPPCQSDWQFDDSTSLNEDNLQIQFTFYDNRDCNRELVGDFTIYLYLDDQYYDEEIIQGISFRNYIDMNVRFDDLSDGSYDYTISFTCQAGECQTGNQWNSPHDYEFVVDEYQPECSAYLQNQQAYLVEEDAEQDAVTMTVDIAIPSEVENACDSHQFELTWRLYIDNQVQYEEHSWEDGWISDSDRADFATFTLDNVAAGTYDPRIILKLDGDTVIDEKWLSYTVTVSEQTVFGCTDSEATNFDESANEDDGSCEYPEPEDPCEVEIQNHYRGHVADDAEQDAILVAFRVVPSNCEGEQIEIDIQLFQNGYDANYSHWQIVSGDVAIDISHTFDGVAVGNSWTPTIIASLDSDILEQVWFWGIDVVEQEPETCEINLFGIEIQTNNTTATVNFDLDCGYDENDLEGYNVSVQFLVYHVNETNSGENATGPLEWTTQVYYIEGYADDVRTLVLDNFTVENTTHYDFYWYAIWEDADGNQQYIEQTWLNRELEV